MNKIKLLGKLQAFFDADERERKNNIEEISLVLKKLKSKQLQTKKNLLNCSNEEYKKALLLEFDVITAQMEKGKKLLKELLDDVK